MIKSPIEVLARLYIDKEPGFQFWLSEEDYIGIREVSVGLPDEEALFNVFLIEGKDTRYGDTFLSLDFSIERMVEQFELYQVRKLFNRKDKPRWMMKNLIAVDAGALQLVRNVLERNGKTEVLEEINKTCTSIEDVLKWYQENEPAKYMSNVTDEMMILYT